MNEGDDPVEIAEERLVAQLMRGTDEARLERNLARALHRTKEPLPGPRPRRSLIRPLSLGLAAAGLLLLWLLLPGDELRAQALRTSMAMARPSDRHYRYELAYESPPGTTIEGDLHLRGKETLTASLELPTGRAWVGRNPDHAWFVPALPLVPGVLLPRGELEPKLREEGLEDLLHLRLGVLFARLPESYRLREGEEAAEPEISTLSGRRRDGAPKNLPEEFTLRAREDGVVTHLETRMIGPATGARVRLRIDLVDEVPREAGFHEAARRAGSRRLIDAR
jgi:hypothetical protein